MIKSTYFRQKSCNEENQIVQLKQWKESDRNVAEKCKLVMNTPYISRQ